ncbi:MAG: hypothetical protein WC375_07060 [Methanomassiliicoccales archaeon]|jgi:hypothetical protein
MTDDRFASDPWRTLLKRSVCSVRGRSEAERLIGETSTTSDQLEDDIEWTTRTIERLEGDLTEVDLIEVPNRCAHVLPDEMIADLWELYDSSGSNFKVHSLWQRLFLNRLKDRYPDLPDELMRAIIDNGWGEPG